MPTVFSRIIEGEIPCYKIAESEKFIAFLDINPLMEGHTLIVPKQETDYIFDIDDQSIGEMMVFAKQVAGQIKNSIKCNRVAVMVLGLEVPHAHIHLIPFNKESDIDFRKPRPKFSPEDFSKTAQLITFVPKCK